MTQVLVLCGGDSDEREVSLRSGAAVARALELAGYDVTTCDTSEPDDKLVSYDVAFPVLHGAGGEDGEVQTRLERLGVAYVGTDAVSSKLCMDKAAYRDAMTASGFLMPGGASVTADEYATHPLRYLPHVLKPIDGGSSVDTIIIRDNSGSDDPTGRGVFDRHERMLLEELIVGTELTVGVLGQTALPVIEIIPPQDEEFDYENKYNGKTQELIPPINVDEVTQKQVQQLALDVHNAAGCRDFTRSDFIVTSNGKCYLLETNTIPGMTDQSLFPKMAAATGLDMSALCNQLVSYALARATVFN